MAVLDRYLLESSTTDGYLLEDGSGVLLLDTSIYRSTILADGPVAYWRLGESAGLRAYDETANNNAAVIIGGVTLGQSGALIGDVNPAALLNGATGYLRADSIAAYDLGNGPLSLEFWIKFTTFTALEAKIFDKSGT